MRTLPQKMQTTAHWLVLLGFVVLAVVCYFRFFWWPDQPRAAHDQVLLKNLHMACEIYCSDWGVYPPGGEKDLIHALTTEVSRDDAPSFGPYFIFEDRQVDRTRGIIVDSYGNPVRYRCPGIHNTGSIDLWTFGPDSKEHTDDDIVNWSTP